jgi:uncharacterized protein YjbI with pentapeptide repeats
VTYQGNPATDCGDIVTLTDLDDVSYTIPVMSLTLNYSGGLTATIESEGETETKNQFDSGGTISDAVKNLQYDLEATIARIDNLIVDTAMIKDLSVTTAKIADAAITSAKIQDASINTAHIIDASITTAKIQDAAITNALIANAAIDSAKIQDAAITEAKIEDAAITNAKIATAAIETAQIQDAAITEAKIADASISSAKIQNAAVGTAQIDTAAITTSLIADGAITSAKIQDAAISTAHIADASITDAKIANITANKIISGSIDTSKVTVQGTNGKLRISNNRLQVFDNQSTPVERVSLGDVNGDGTVYGFRVRGADGTTILMDENGVHSEGITDGAITNPKIADGAVGTDELQDESVTNAKVANASIDTAKIQTGSITTALIADAAITSAKIQDAAITNAKIAAAAVGTAQIADAAITSAKIADAAITNAKIDSLDASKITSGYISASRIAADSIDASKLNVSTLSAISANLGNVTSGNITGVRYQSDDGIHYLIMDAGHAEIVDGTFFSIYNNYSVQFGVGDPLSPSKYVCIVMGVDTETQKGYIDSQDDWIEIRALAEFLKGIKTEAWHTVTTFQNGWSAYNASSFPVQYMKDPMGFVHLRGLVGGGTQGYNTVFTLPAGYRPQYAEYFGTTQSNIDYVPRIEVTPDGNVYVVNGGTNYTSLSGITFYAGR